VDANNNSALWANEAEFKEYAAEMHAGEINMAELAKQKSRTPAVREYADQVIAGHSDALKELTKSTGQNRTTIMGSFDTSNHIGDLSPLQGADFDRLFVDLMIADHKDASSTFHEQLDAAKDGDFADYLRNSIPMLEKSRQRAQELKTDLDKGRATED
jgi:putative membrane protein